MMNQNILGNPSILLVEDNPGDVVLFQQVLEENKLTRGLSTVKDGAGAMSYLQRDGKNENALFPDIILLDLDLPRRDEKKVLKDILIQDCIVSKFASTLLGKTYENSLLSFLSDYYPGNNSSAI